MVEKTAPVFVSENKKRGKLGSKKDNCLLIRFIDPSLATRRHNSRVQADSNGW